VAQATTGRQGAITVTSSGGSATLTVNESAFVSGTPTTALLSQIQNYQATQTLTVTAGSPNGPGYLSTVEVLAVSGIGNGYAYCQMFYYPQYNSLAFVGTGNPLNLDQVNTTSYTLGTPGQTATGYHCNLDVADSSAKLDPTSASASVTLNLVLTLQTSALGPQNVFVIAEDNSGNSNGWNQGGSWTAYNPLTANPPSVSMPSPGAATGQLLHYHVNDGNGYAFVNTMSGQLGRTTSQSNSACYFEFFLPDIVELYQAVYQTAGPLKGQYVMSAAGTGYLGGSWTSPPTQGILGGTPGQEGPGGPGTCWIDLNQSSVSTGTDGTGTVQNPNTGSASQQITDLYLDLWTGLDG